MKAIIKNLIKSFWLAKGKLLLCITAAILSAWGISVMVYSYAMTERDYIENFTKSNPASIVLVIKNASNELIAKIKADVRILDVERRDVIAARVRNRNGNMMSLLLFAAEDIRNPRINKFKLDATKGDLSHAILIEKNGLGFLNPKDDSLTVRVPGFETTPYYMGGSVYDPGQAPSQMEQALYGYTSLENITALKADDNQRLLITTKQPGLNAVELSLIGGDLKRLAEEMGAGATFNVPPPGEHPHQGIVDGIAFLQRSFGAVLSLLGAILLSLILITWLFPQIANIGIMKAVGASTKMVFSGYMIVLLLVIFVGLLVGMPLGYKTAKMYSGSVAFIQNFDPIDQPLPFINHIIAAIPVLIIPMLFALVPLLQASRTTVQNAMSQVFYTPYKFVFVLTQRLLNDTKLKYSTNNLFRSNQRTTLLLILLTAGIALFTTGSNLKYSLKTDFEKYASNSGYQITMVLKDSMNVPLTFLDSLPFVESVAYVTTRTVRYKSPAQSYEENAALWTFPPGYQFDRSRLIKGAIKEECPECVYISQRLEPDFKKTPLGSAIELRYGKDRRVKYIYSGVIKDITHPGFFAFGDKPTQGYYEVAIALREGTNSTDAARLLDDSMLDHDIDVRQIADAKTALLALENHLKPMYLVIQVIGVATIVIALAGLIIVLNLSIQERGREMGIMKAIGGTATSIVNMYHREYFAVTIAAILLGSIVGHFFNAAICKLFGFMVINSPVPPLYDVQYLAVAAIGVLATQTIVITLYARYKVSQVSNRLLTEIV